MEGFFRLVTIAIVCAGLPLLNSQHVGANALIYQPDGNTFLLMHFDEREKLPKDSSKLKNRVTISTACWTESGRLGGALEFNGKDNLEIALDASTKLRDAFTIECWIKAISL